MFEKISSTKQKETKEKLSVSTIAGKDLFNEIYKDHQPDERFTSMDSGGVFHYAPLGNNSEINKEGIFYSTLRTTDGTIIGIAELQYDTYDNNELWFKSISIDESMKERGLSQRLLEEVFRFAKSTGRTLKLSRYSDEGAERISHKINALAKKFGVTVT